MTQKEELLVKYYETMNEVAKLNETGYTHNVEQMVANGEIRNEARKTTAYILEDKLEAAQNSLMLVKKNKARKAYLATDEGMAAYDEIEQKKETMFSEMTSMTDEVSAAINELLAEHIHTNLKVRRLAPEFVEIGLEPGHQFNEFHIFFGKNLFDKSKERFEISVGSTGSFDLGSERATFYYCLGQFLSSMVQNDVRKLLFGYNDYMEDYSKKWNALQKEQDNLGVETL